MEILKVILTSDEVDMREREQRKLTAEYLQGQIQIEEYKEKMDKVATPLDLVALASKLKFNPKQTV